MSEEIKWPVRVITRVFIDGALDREEEQVFHSREELERVVDLAERHLNHVVAKAKDRLFYIEIEFPDDPDPSDRFRRFGTDPRGMRNAVKLAPEDFAGGEPTRIYLAEVHCPQGHVLHGCSFKSTVPPAPEDVTEAVQALRERLDRQMEEGKLPRWCGRCRAPEDAWNMVVAITPHRTLEEARELSKRREEAAQETLAAALRVQKASVN